MDEVSTYVIDQGNRPRCGTNNLRANVEKGNVTVLVNNKQIAELTKHRVKYFWKIATRYPQFRPKSARSTN